MANNSNNECKPSRIIMLGNEVTGETVSSIIKEIVNYNAEDDKKEKELKDYERPEITFIIKSYGGSVYDGFALIGAIEMSKTPIHGLVLGPCMSMGFAIALSCHYRKAHRLARFMYHQISDAPYGKLEYIKQEAEESQTLQDLYDDIVLKRTKIMKEKLEDIKEKRKEWYIGADDALKLEIIDEVV